MRNPVLAAVCASVLAGGLVAQVEAPVKKTGQEAKKQKHSKKKRPTRLSVGSTVPADLVLPDMDGKVHKFGDMRGKVVFIHFWSIRCPWEKYAEPVILKMEKKYAKKDVVLLAINANQREIGGVTPPSFKKRKKGDEKPYANLRAHCERVDFGHTVLLDHGNRVADLFAARTTPHCYVIDKKGVIRYAGALDDYAQHRDKDLVEPLSQNAIDALLEGKEPKVKSSKPYG